MGVLGIQKLIKETTHNQMQRDVSLGKQGRSQKKVGGKSKIPPFFKASPTPKLIIIKKELLGWGRGHLVPCQHLMLSGVSFFFF